MEGKRLSRREVWSRRWRSVEVGCTWKMEVMKSRFEAKIKCVVEEVEDKEAKSATTTCM